ncbi:Transposon Tf2-2 poly [Paramuricea clavata]|uniref:Transposon Tf2-2 poly n=1 Tax=Paramuricea clavata TaxID=317549 RepID=A0A7D9MEI8_PARCT|nr:Transposon Tf2-2 poly [Paramuricea clavata]
MLVDEYADHDDSSEDSIVAAVSSGPTSKEIRLAQDVDLQLQSWISNHKKKDSGYRPALVDFGDKEVWCQMSSSSPKILVPTSLQSVIFRVFHEVGHPGNKATYKMISKGHYWPNMRKEISLWTKSCISCQMNKVHRHTKSPIGSIPLPSSRFSDLNVDIVGPINPPHRGKNYLFTIIDRWSGYMEAYPMDQKGLGSNAEACSRHFLRWCSTFGTPSSVTSDRGSQFVSRLWSSTMSSLSITHNLTRPTILNTTGRLNGRTNWVDELPWALLSLRNSPNTDSGVSPSEIVFGEKTKFPGEIRQSPSESSTSVFASSLMQAIKNQVPPKEEWHQPSVVKTFVPKELFSCKHVFVRVDKVQPGLKQKFTGPFEVVSRSPKSFLVKLETGEDFVNIDRLRPAFLQEQ